MSDKNKRKYAYEKAIEAYWHHVDRYHTWMNYYALFNGALFVGYCTLLTATTKITDGVSDSNIPILLAHSLSLENSYCSLMLIICTIGLISSFCWLLSLYGHTTWMNNWLNIIQLYENEAVYGLIITQQSNMKLNQAKNIGLNVRSLEKEEHYKAFSTSKVTKCFISAIILGWFILLIYTILNSCNCMLICGAILLLVFALMYIFITRKLLKEKEKVPFQDHLFSLLYSDIHGKTIYMKEKKEAIIYQD